nr:reverse transcriptase domain-containing protein [Tanacetum cinerariifolium]
MQHNISELTALCTSLQRQYSELQAKFQAQEEEIVKLKDRVKVLEDKKDVAAIQSGDDALIKGRSINEGEAAAKRISNDSEVVAWVLTSMDAATVLAGGIDVPIVGPPATIISTGSKVGPTASPIVTRRKGKEVMVESDTPKKKKLQEQIDAQVARELKEQQEKENMRMNEQIARVARIHAEEELQGMIDSLDKIVPLFDTMLVHQGEGSGTPTEPHHTPFLEAETSHPTTSSIPLPSIPTAPIPPVTQPYTTPIRQYTRRARIAQSSALPSVADEPASLVRDVNEREACPTDSSFIADQDRATIAKSSTFPHDSAPMVTSPAADEGSMQHNISKLMALCTSLQRVKVLEDKEDDAATQSGDDAPIKGRSINEGEAAAERISNDSKDVARVLTSIDAATVLAGGIDVPTGSGSIPTGSGSIPTVGPPATIISTGSKVGPTASLIVTRRKGKEVMVESDTPKKKKLQEQIDAQVVRELEEQQEKENMRMNEQIAKDAEVARIHVEEELQGMIDSLDKSNETIAKFKDFKGMTFKEIEAKFTEVWKQLEDFIPMGSKEETERLKRKGLNLEKEQVKKQKLSEEAPKIETSTKEFTKEKMKEMMQLVPIIRLGGSSACYQLFIDLLKQLDREDLNQLWALVKEYLSIRPATKWKLYDLSGVHHVTAKDKEIFMLVEKDYPLRRGLALVMISYKLQIENYSQMAEDLIRKIYNIANTPRRLEMPLPEVCTAIEEKKKKLPAWNKICGFSSKETEDKHQDTVGFEYGQNRKNKYFGPSIDTGKFHEIPNSYHNKENLINHVDSNYHYSSDCNSVPVHRQTGTVVDNHNHHVNYFHINCTSNSRTEVVEVHPTNNRSTKDVQPLVVPTESSILNSKPVVAPIIEPVASPVSAPRPDQKPLIPYQSRLHDQKLRDKANDQQEKFFQIFKDLNFNISIANALILMPKFGPSIKSLLTNKDKLCELARTLLNKHCSAILLKKLPEKLRDPGASINLMPLSVWNKLSLLDLSPTCMTLELADHLISHSVGVFEDVFDKVGDLFLKTKRDLIDVFKGKLTLRVGKVAITFNLDQTSSYSANYNDMTANRIDVIDMACEEYSQEVLGFFDVIATGNPTPYYDLIVSTISLTLTPFENSDFILKEVDAFLALEDYPTSPKVDQSYVDTEGDILFLEAFLNDDPSLPPPNQGNYLPQV